MKSGARLTCTRSMALLLCGLLFAGGCATAGRPSDTAPRERPLTGGTLVTTTIADAAVLLPTVAADSASAFVNGYVYDSLLTFDHKLDLYPALAESYAVAEDRVYTFKLKQGVRFHDGTPMTSADVLFTFLTIAHPGYTGVRFGDFRAVKGWSELGRTYAVIRSELDAKAIDEQTARNRMLEAFRRFSAAGGFSAPDPHTFRVELEEQYAPALVTIGSYGIMPKHLLEPHMADLKSAPQARRPIGTGAYRLVEWVKDERIVLERNPDWQHGVRSKPANIERIMIRIVPDSQANMMALEIGETDTASIDPDNYGHFKSRVGHVNVLEYQGFSYTYLGYNLKDPLFEDRRVRRALTHAINRQEMVDQILRGHGAVAHSHGAPVRWDYNPDVPVYDYSPARAEALLDEAGWRRGPDGIRVKDGRRLAFEIATNNGNKVREQAAVIIQQALARVGVEVRISLMEWSAFLNHVDGDKKQAYLLGWGIGIDPDAHSIFHSRGGFNMMHGYSNLKVDALIERGRMVADRAERKALYGEMQRILAEDQVYTWLFFQRSITGYHKRVAGLPKDLGAIGPLWAFEDWYLTEQRTSG